MNNRLSFLKVMAIQGRLFIIIIISCAMEKRFGFCCFISANLRADFSVVVTPGSYN